MSDTESNFSSLYKSNSPGHDQLLARRRFRLLAEQKIQRRKSADDPRGIHQLLNELTIPDAVSSSRRRNKRTPTKFRHTLQLSEWLTGRPEDFHNWFMVGCPKGVRCLVVANAGKTLVFGKNGGFIKKIRSQLPGDVGNQQDVTILDCISIPSGEFFVLDALAYGKVDLINCDVSFRFFWIQSRMSGDELSEVQNEDEAIFKRVKYVDLAEDGTYMEMLETFPMYENNVPELDGLLFYHKESSYVHGKTPLVGWLYPYMIHEVLGFSGVHPTYKAMEPPGYSDLPTYIKFFKAKMERKANRSRLRKELETIDAMEEESVDFDSTAKAELVELELNLE